MTKKVSQTILPLKNQPHIQPFFHHQPGHKKYQKHTLKISSKTQHTTPD